MSSPVYILVVDTNKYAGNFERQLAKAILYPDPDFEVFEDYPGTSEIFEWLAENHRPHNEHNDQYMYHTPGWYNNGYGTHKPDADYKSGDKFPAYLSVALDFRTHPTPEVLAYVRWSVDKFASMYSSNGERVRIRSNNKITITGIRVLSRCVVIEEVWSSNA